MADTAKIWPIFRWANWWLSDDLFTGIRNSFYYSNDMEIRQDAKSIYPMWVPAYADPSKRAICGDGSTWNLRSEPVCVFFSENDGGWVICGKRNIWLMAADGTVSDLCTLSTDICDAEMFNWYIYVATRQYLYYKKYSWSWTDMASATNASSQNFWRCNETLSNIRNHPLYASDTMLVVWDWNLVRYVSKEIPNLLQDGLTLQTNYSIRFINELWWYIRTVAVDDPYWSEVILWDKVSTAPQEIIPLEWYSIIWATIYNWYHYLLSDKWLWLLNWYQYYLLKKSNWSVDSYQRNNMCVYNDKLYFVCNDWIYIYWAKNKNYADVLNLWHKVEEWYTLWAIWSYNSWIMVTRSWLIWSPNVPIYVWVNEWQATTWEVQTMCYFGTSMSEIKQSMYLRVGYHIAKEWTESWNIHIYYRTEADAITDNAEDWQWHEATKPAWLYADWDMRSPFATTLKLNCRFQWIQFKFVLTNCVYDDNWTTKTKDTNLYSADLYYNVMLD